MSFYNVLAFLCKNSQDAARAAARFGNGDGIGRFFIFLGKAPTAEETSWMMQEDTKIVLERVIEHPEAEQMAVRATFMYSGAHAWNIVFCWADNFPEFQSISQAFKELDLGSDRVVNGFLWGATRESVVLQGFKSAYRGQNQQLIHSRESHEEYGEESSIQLDLEMSVALRGFPSNWTSIISAINEVAPMGSVAIHESAVINSDYDSFLKGVAALGKNNSTKPLTVLMSGSVSAELLDKVRRGLPKRGVVIVATTSIHAEELEKSLPYRSFIHKEGFKVLLFKAL